MHETRVLKLLQQFNSETIFVKSEDNINDAYALYKHLSKEQIHAKLYFNLCGGLSSTFKKILEIHNYKVNYIGVYHSPINQLKSNSFSNLEYLNAIQFNKLDTYLTNTIEVLPYETAKRNTHAFLEICINDVWRVVDPTTGILYLCGKEELMRGNMIIESIKSLNQIEYLIKNHHNKLQSLYYSSPSFWKSVYHISMEIDGRGDLPEIN